VVAQAKVKDWAKRRSSDAMSYNGIVLLAVVLCLTSPGLHVLAKEGRYPQEALECYASSAMSQKEGKIVCPPGNSLEIPAWLPGLPYLSRSFLSFLASPLPAKARPCA